MRESLLISLVSQPQITEKHVRMPRFFLFFIFSFSSNFDSFSTALWILLFKVLIGNKLKK